MVEGLVGIELLLQVGAVQEEGGGSGRGGRVEEEREAVHQEAPVLDVRWRRSQRAAPESHRRQEGQGGEGDRYPAAEMGAVTPRAVEAALHAQARDRSQEQNSQRTEVLEKGEIHLPGTLAGAMLETRAATRSVPCTV